MADNVNVSLALFLLLTTLTHYLSSESVGEGNRLTRTLLEGLDWIEA